MATRNVKRNSKLNYTKQCLYLLGLMPELTFVVAKLIPIHIINLNILNTWPHNMTSFYLVKSLGTEELQNCKIITHSPCWSASKPGVAMTMTSETAQELREGGSSKPRTIKYAGHTLKVGTIGFSSIANLHCRTTGKSWF